MTAKASETRSKGDRPKRRRGGTARPRSSGLPLGKVRVPWWVVWTVAGLVAVVVVSMVADGAIYAGKIHAGVSIAGQKVSGLDRAAATEAVSKTITESQARSVTLVSDQKTWTVTPETVGLTLNVDAAVSAALGETRDSNIFADQASKLSLYFSGRDIALEAAADQAKLDALLTEVATTLDHPAVDAGVALQGLQVKQIAAQDGITVDKQLLQRQLVEALCKLESSQVTVPTVVDKPEVTTEGSAAALTQVKTMLSSPLTLTSVGQKWTFTPAQIVQWIAFKAEVVDGANTTVAYLSADKMAPTFERMAKLMPTTPVNARFEGDETRAWVVPGIPGRVIKSEETMAAMNAALLKTTGRTAEVAADLTEPEFTTAEAEAMGIKDVLSERTTAFEGTKNRQNNVRVATAAIHNGGNTILAPGEEFSFLKLVGDRTPEQGYKEAFGIQANGSLDGELGGGICQVATTVFNAAFWAGLKVTERRNHSMYISHYPEGRDAAVTTDTDGTIDLKFVNDTDHYIWIKGESDGITTTFWVYGTSDGRKVTFRNSGRYNIGAAPPVWQSVDNSLPAGKTVIISPGQPRMQIKITRWITWPDGTVKEDVFMSQYYQRPKIVHVGPS